VAGFGCVQADSQKVLSRLSECLNIPVASSLKGKGAIDESSALSLGSLGVTSSGYALQYIMNEADLVILLGAGFNERTSYVWNENLLKNKTVIQVDQNPQQLEKVFTQISMSFYSRSTIHARVMFWKRNWSLIFSYSRKI
jgi:acetolactate synthase-1/2/3 large subunit